MLASKAAKTFECDICSATLTSQRALDNHKCLVHDDCSEARLGTPITFRCATCGQAFTRRSDLYGHQLKTSHGHPAEWDKARPPGTPRPRRKPRSRGD
jgi:uncharacterized C2H2 Zn-finger protein